VAKLTTKSALILSFRRFLFAAAVAGVALLGSAGWAQAQDFFEWLSHYDPTTPQGRVNLNPLNRGPLNNGSDLPDAKPPAPAPTGFVRIINTTQALNFTVYRYTDRDNRSGMFYKAKGNTWINNASDGRIFYFTQTPQSNNEFIELHDFSRNFTCRLFSNGTNYFLNNQYGWVPGAPGYWVE